MEIRIESKVRRSDNRAIDSHVGNTWRRKGSTSVACFESRCLWFLHKGLHCTQSIDVFLVNALLAQYTKQCLIVKKKSVLKPEAVLDHYLLRR